MPVFPASLHPQGVIGKIDEALCPEVPNRKASLLAPVEIAATSVKPPSHLRRCRWAWLPQPLVGEIFARDVEH